jgi:NADH-quinone oxidoreductase subunit C
MSNEELLESLAATFEGVELKLGKQFVEMTVTPERLLEIAQKLREDKSFDLDYMCNLTGVDLDNVLGVVYHFESYALKHTLVLKCFAVDREKAEIPSLMHLWPTAELHEDEAFDFYGFNFVGHSNLRHFLLPEDWVGFPLRKDYYDPVNLIQR